MDCTALQGSFQNPDLEGAGGYKISPVLDVFVSEDEGSCALTMKYRHHCRILHGYEQAVELRNGYVNRQTLHQELKERIRC